MGTLTHFDDAGAAHMVDVGAKEVTARAATASAVVRMLPATLSLILDRKLAKGDVLETARLAGIMAAKQTADLIPLCHPIPIDTVDVRLAAEGVDAIRIEATVRSTGRTGVEMEALTAAAIAGLTIYDMCKSADRGMVLERVQLENKRGGKSGEFRRAAQP